MYLKTLACGLLALSLCQAAGPDPARISPDSLRANLSFLSSDLLEGRYTPSRGLDIAAEYIAAQFRRLGLEPAGDNGYFQTASLFEVAPEPEAFGLTIHSGGKAIQVDAKDAEVISSETVDLKGVPVVKPSAADVKGKVVVVTGSSRRAVRELRSRGAAAIVATLPSLPGPPPFRPLLDASVGVLAQAPFVMVVDSVLRDLDATATADLKISAPKRTPCTARNVIGILRGSDPQLKDTYVLVTAHYDHIGTRPDGDDRIYNGANDDGSGTVSVIEIASAFAAMPQRPKRSIVFMTFFGEERGSIGANYYVRHPVFPLARTVADINLEQLGRTDGTDGKHVADVTFTGYHFTDLTAVFEKAGKAAGVKVHNDEKYGDEFFSRSDNQTFANAGIPAHTVCVAFDYPDYHGVGDEWGKIDYDNMAKVDRMLAGGIGEIADSATPPKWNGSPKTGRYVEAAKKLTASTTP